MGTGHIPAYHRYRLPRQVRAGFAGGTAGGIALDLLAAMHRQLGMAIGNAVGSNTLNILVVIGITTLFADICGPTPSPF